VISLGVIIPEAEVYQGRIVPLLWASTNMLALPGTLVLWSIPAFICLLIHALYLGIKACGALKVGVFRRFFVL